MTFERNAKKKQTNQKKHSVSFERAAGVWKDPKRIVFYDELHSIEEDRWIVIGFSGTVLFVVLTERNEETVRIISARKASNEEIERYYCDYDIR